PRLAEVPDQAEFQRLQVLDAAPGEVRGLLAGEAREVALLDERHARALACERGRRNGAVDPAADDEGVEDPGGKFFEVGVPQTHARSLARSAWEGERRALPDNPPTASAKALQASARGLCLRKEGGRHESIQRCVACGRAGASRGERGPHEGPARAPLR